MPSAPQKYDNMPQVNVNDNDNAYIYMCEQGCGSERAIVLHQVTVGHKSFPGRYVDDMRMTTHCWTGIEVSVSRRIG